MEITKPRLYNILGVLYLIYRTAQIKSRIRLQKLICLVQYENKENPPLSFEFKSYYYGPYSESLREETDALVRIGLLNEELKYRDNGPGCPPSYFYVYSLTDRGKDFLKINKEDLREIAPRIKKVIDKYGESSNDTIIKAAKEASGMLSLK